MLTTDPKTVASIIDKIEALLHAEALTEDPITGLIELDKSLYTKLGKQPPANAVTKVHRAKALVEPYQKLWPTKIVSGGRPVRQGPVALMKKLTVFINKHPKITDEQILDATKRYLAIKAKDNYQFTMCSDYFIEKGGNSTLESFVVNAEAGKVTEAKSINQRFV